MADGVTRTQERIDHGSGTGLGTPWNVIVLNDSHNTFDGVAVALSQVLPDVSFDQGMSFANRIHSTGRAVVWSGPPRGRGALLERSQEAGFDDGPAGPVERLSRSVARFSVPARSRLMFARWSSTIAAAAAPAKAITGHG